MSRPLVWIAILFSAGIIIAKFIAINFWFVFAVTLAIFSLSIISINKKLSFSIILLIFSALSGILTFENSQTLPKCHISNFIYYKNNNFYSVKGAIESLPEINNAQAHFIFVTKEIHFRNSSYSCCGKILVHAKKADDLYCGQALILKGYMYPAPASRLAARGYFGYLKEQGVHCIMRVDSENMVIAQNRCKRFSIKGFALRLKQGMEEKICRYMPNIPASVLEAMILGQQKNVPKVIYNAMVKTGTVHILVVSGFNVGIVIFIVTLSLKLIRMPRKPRFIIAIPCLILYCLVTGASTPVVRATTMGIFFLVAYLIKREPDIYNSLSLAALFILLVSPNQLFNIGFQLSFISVISIVYFYPRFKTLISLDRLENKFLRFLAEGFAVSLSAWLGTLGFIAFYFRIISPVTILANLFIVPLATLITLCGICLIFAGLIIPPLAPYFASTSELVVTLLVKLNLFLSSLPCASFSLPY
jgi:competence protein ComEC